MFMFCYWFLKFVLIFLKIETLQKTAERMEKEDKDKARRALEQAVQAKSLPEKESETLQTGKNRELFWQFTPCI